MFHLSTALHNLGANSLQILLLYRRSSVRKSFNQIKLRLILRKSLFMSSLVATEFQATYCLRNSHVSVFNTTDTCSKQLKLCGSKHECRICHLYFYKPTSLVDEHSHKSPVTASHTHLKNK